jgi:hypothetical protein
MCKQISLYSEKIVRRVQPFHVLIQEVRYLVLPILKPILFVFLMQIKGLCLFSDKFVSLLMMTAYFDLNYLCHMRSN